MSDENKMIVRRFVEEFQGQGRMDVGEEVLAAGFRNRTPDPGTSDGREAVLNQFAALHAGLPDLRVTVHALLADGDRVATHKTFQGTHSGDLMGIPPSGRPVALEVMDIVRVQDGQIVEHWNVVDRLSLIRQLAARSIARFLFRQLSAAVTRRPQGRAERKSRRPGRSSVLR